ncbi:MAG: PspC domain-containing protein [Chitinophagales bacterium]|nr:PspC domain-containing protein [Chitinophagales bacterium]
MNKTVTINLSGIVFHIDENAYEQLRQYLDRLKGHFAGTQGKEEIITDIEGRLAEMFTERAGDSKNVIMMEDVKAVIDAMGKPEDFVSDEEVINKNASGTGDANTYYENVKKRFFRNPDEKMIGGVCSGIASYFNVDPLWIRLVFVLLVIMPVLSGVLIYIILWIIIPEAVTASDKLQMRGEPVTIRNIEKNVKEEMENLRKKGEAWAQNISSDQVKTKARSATQNIFNFFGEIIRGIIKFIIVIFGIFITIMSIAVLIGLTIAIFTGIGAFRFAVPHTITNMVLSTSQIWWLAIGGLLAIGIPFILLLLNGLKILFRLNLNLRMIGAVMAGLWLVGIGICAYHGIRIATEFSDSATVKQKYMLTALSGNIISLKATRSFEGSNDDYSFHHHNIHFGTGDLFTLSENSDSVLSHEVRIDIEQSDNDSSYIIQKINSCGKTYDEARHLANNVSYHYFINDSVINFSDYFKMNTRDKYRGQEIKVILMLAVGKSVMLDKSMGDLLDNVHNISDTYDYDMLGHTWTMTKDGLKCNNCPEYSDKEENDDHDSGTRIRIDSTGVEIKTL